MKNFDIKELTLDNLVIWPKPVKTGIMIFCCLLILGLGYWFDLSAQLQLIRDAEQKESTLRSEFQMKAMQSKSLPAYRKQLADIQQRLAGMVKQLPNSTEIPNLLEEISKAGVANGLQFQLFKPMPENDLGFFIELPIQISVIGNYHQLGLFVSQIAGLNRIVTLQNFSIAAYKDKPDAVAGKGQAIPGPGEERLLMDLTAKTYRYPDVATDGKNATKDKKDADNKKQ